MTYKITLNFAGYCGCEQTYEVDANNREEAEEMAKQEALWDLDVIGVEVDDED